MDPIKNFAYSTVAAAPSPANSGTTLSVKTGDGDLFPASADGPFTLVVWPKNVQPTSSNAMLIRVSGRAGDVLTFARQHESSANRSIEIGDQIAQIPTAALMSFLNDRAGGGTTYTVAASNSPALLKKRADYVCDGTDDHVQIQQALDALASSGGVVELVEGQFSLGAALTITHSNVTLRSTLATKIVLANGKNVDMLRIGTSGSSISHVNIEGLWLNGNRANQSAGHGIHLFGARYCTIVNCLIEEVKQWALFADGADGDGFGYNNTFLNNITDTSGGALKTAYSEAEHIIGNQFKWASGVTAEETWNRALVLLTSGGNFVTNNVFGNGGDYPEAALILQNTLPSRIIGNRFDITPHEAIRVDSANQIVTGNDFGSCCAKATVGTEDVISLGAGHNTITDNVFYNTFDSEFAGDDTDETHYAWRYCIHESADVDYNEIDNNRYFLGDGQTQAVFLRGVHSGKQIALGAQVEPPITVVKDLTTTDKGQLITYKPTDNYIARSIEFLERFHTWLNGAPGFIGEVGIPSNLTGAEQENYNNMLDVLLTYMQRRNLSWTYWATGHHWGTYNLRAYAYSAGVWSDTPISPILKKHYNDQVPFTGVNYSYLEFDGGPMSNPVYEDILFHYNQGVRTIRLPVKMEYLWTWNANAITQSEFDKVVEFLEFCHMAGIDVILDIHNYAKYDDGTSRTLQSHPTEFKKFYTVFLNTAYVDSFGVSRYLKYHPALRGLDPQNEPANITMAQWETRSQELCDHLRDTVKFDKDIFWNIGNYSQAIFSFDYHKGGFWIQDPLGKSWAQAHAYFNSIGTNGSWDGTYGSTSTYANEVTSASAYAGKGVYTGPGKVSSNLSIATKHSVQATGYVASLSDTITASGNDLYAIVIAASRDADAITGATYGGVAMTELSASYATGVAGLKVYGLANPATGAQTVTIEAPSYKLLEMTTIVFQNASGADVSVFDGYGEVVISSHITKKHGAYLLQTYNTNADRAAVSSFFDTVENITSSEANLGSLCTFGRPTDGIGSYTLYSQFTGDTNFRGAMIAIEPKTPKPNKEQFVQAQDGLILSVTSNACTPDASLNKVMYVTHNAGLTINNPLSPKHDGQTILLGVKNSGGSPIALTAGSAFRFGSDLTAFSNVAAGKINYIEAIYRSDVSKWDVIREIKGF